MTRKANESDRPDRITQIEDLGALQFGPDEIAVILNAPIAPGEEETAYLRGRLRAEAEVRKSILQMARSGSSPAQKAYLDLVEIQRNPRKRRR